MNHIRISWHEANRSTFIKSYLEYVGKWYCHVNSKDGCYQYWVHVPLFYEIVFIVLLFHFVHIRWNLNYYESRKQKRDDIRLPQVGWIFRMKSDDSVWPEYQFVWFFLVVIRLIVIVSTTFETLSRWASLFLLDILNEIMVYCFVFFCHSSFKWLFSSLSLEYSETFSFYSSSSPQIPQRGYPSMWGSLNNQC